MLKEKMVELTEDVSASPLYNEDLAPTTLKDRKWTTYNFAALWIGMAHCIPTYMLSSGLIALGMSWQQAIFTITLGNLIVLIPMILNAHPGTKYGIPFPVLARAAFGTKGANIPALLRAGVACGWFGINAFIGGVAINNFLVALFPAWKTFGGDFMFAGLSLPSLITFLFFWGLNILLIYKGMDAIRKFENWAAPLVLIMTFVLLVWIVGEAKGFGPILETPGKLATFDQFFPVFVPSLTGMIAFWATLSLNIPDFTRFGKGQKEQMLGQAIGLPPTMTIFSAMGVIITSATVAVYGKAIWDPVDLLLNFSNPLVLILSLIGIMIATLSVNIAANIVSPANDFSNLAPKHISFKMGGLITGILGILMMPWKLLSDPSMYIFNWLGVYSGFLGPIAAIMIADYFIIRKRELNLGDLYKTEGEYTYSGGFNLAAVLALFAGVGVALVGKFIPAVEWLFNYSWFVGFGVAFTMYVVLMRTMAENFNAVVPSAEK
ncbi:putative allantoin permease [Propionispora sp. 2/2-37]|uniref:NCS1 family nucleobase:cation symporter-1 n=1 Tax=Propionispora sp. 2/2-37 TaxID=1677858 RepID=UPI0006BB87C9|nr:NCS1 family nucleobase:cation symporter-1 [Propionispora sp. 2/2-37]CUH94876.1 putative allantoin permease [Propionispora sp. 2/2-37]